MIILWINDQAVECRILRRRILSFGAVEFLIQRGNDLLYLLES